ncbi:MAG: DUF3883 domain-containing protein [Caulobacteraceae bacterium]
MKYAVKLLSSSDLTLFAAFYRLNPSSRQKGTNLNSDVIADILFPDLPKLVTGSCELPVTLDVYGPNGAPLHRQRRKIIKPEGGKNWRLNGKLVEAPNSDRDRYSSLSTGDVAIFAFDGNELPTSVSMVLFSTQSDADERIVGTLRADHRLAPGARSMTALSPDQLRALCRETATDHPLRLLLPDEERIADLIEAGAGNEDAVERLVGRIRDRRARPVSADELASARARATEIGRAGEVLFSKWLQSQEAGGKILAFEWSSDTNAVSPFDFSVRQFDGSTTLIDVKTTTGDFSGQFHISAAELALAADEVDYRIARIFHVEDLGGAYVRISSAIRSFAVRVRDAVNDLPDGVTVGSVQIDSRLLTWCEVEPLPLADEDEDDN